MNLASKLKQRAAEGRPIRVGLIGSGKFGSMFLSQARTTVGLHLMAIADLSAERARNAMANTGWDVGASVASSFEDARKAGATMITEDAEALIRADGIDVVIDATGSPAAGIRHALLACENGRHMVMVNVEADVLAGPHLADRFRKAGLVYSMAYGDQPALVCEMVDWAQACGFEVVAAGKGTKYLPSYHASTPDTVWNHYGLTAEQAERAGMQAQMFNSFLDGTKSAIEMAAISNATGLKAPADGLLFPPASAYELATVLRPKADGGVLEEKGMVEVVSSLNRDGSEVANDLRWGVYVVFEPKDQDVRGDYARRCFAEYGVKTDPSGRYASLWRPSHLIGLELGVSVASAALRGEATGAPTGFRADAVACAKKALAEGETLDGEGGYTVWGKVIRAEDSLSQGALPIGLAHKVKLRRAVPEGEVVRWEDVAIEDSQAVRVRREMEREAQGGRAIAAE